MEIQFDETTHLLLIGDIHGGVARFNTFIRALDDHWKRKGVDLELLEPSSRKTAIVQLGDWGVGWEDAHFDLRLAGKLFMLDGNHEHFPMLLSGEWEYSRQGIKYLERGTILEFNIPDGPQVRFGVVGGADSIDRPWRTAGVDWFPHERISPTEGSEIATKFSSQGVDKILAHDVPLKLYSALVGKNVHDLGGTSRVLQDIYEKVSPTLWIHGHHHKRVTQKDYPHYDSLEAATVECIDTLSHYALNPKVLSDLRNLDAIENCSLLLDLATLE